MRKEFDVIKEAIKRFLNIMKTAEISESAKQEFYRELADSNIMRGKIISVLLILIELIVITASIIKDPADVLIAPKLYYHVMYIIFILSTTIVLIIINFISRNENYSVKKAMTVTYTFLIFIIVWNMFITLMDQRSSGSLLSYFTTIIAASVIVYIKPKVLVIAFSSIQISFIILLPFFLPAGESPFAEYVNSTIAATVSIFLGYILYQNKANNFVQRKIIEQKNKQLNHLNKRLKETNKTLEYLSQTDGLTGIHNRRMFDKLSKNYWIKCKQNNVSLSVIMMDIDHFREYNDNFGHQSGDECLIKLVNSLTKTLKDFNGTKDSMLARYGGEEFILMTCGMSEEKALSLAESIRKNVEAIKIEREYKEVADHITLSLGVYTGMPADETSMLLDYIGNADKALYCAKNDGRNVTRIYNKKAPV